jgi:hypothetical protein
MGDKRKGTVDRKLKFSPDPASPLDVLEERIRQLENETRLLRQSLQVTTLHTFDRAPYIDAVQGEVLWDFQFQRGYIFHHEKWRPLAPPTYHIKVFPDTRPVATGDEKFVFMVSRDMGGYTPDLGEPYPSFYLYDAEAYVSTTGANTIQIRNVTQSNDMLSTPLTIDSGEFTTRTATTQRVIDPGDSVVDWGDLISIDVDVAGGYGLGVILVFNPIVD